jgi:hypothetical protein
MVRVMQSTVAEGVQPPAAAGCTKALASRKEPPRSVRDFIDTPFTRDLISTPRPNRVTLDIVGDRTDLLMTGSP